jgi:spore cortex formation protein SpoVR/YcgB (stage V sporulation)
MVKKLQLFSYGNQNANPAQPQSDQSQEIVITSRERDEVVEALLTPRYNYGVPQIVVKDVVKNELYLEHLNRHVSFLDRRYATETLAYIAELWKHPVHILTNNEQSQEVDLEAEP